MSYIISIWLDRRRAKSNGKFPVKLRAYKKSNQKEKSYSINTSLSINEFETIWINPKDKNLRGKNKEIYLKLQAIEQRANKEAGQMTVFDFPKFETKMFRKSSDQNNVQYHFNLAIDKNKENDKIGTSESYKYTLNSLAIFSKIKNKIEIEKLTFEAINVEWLSDYEKFMLSKGKSYTTISIYTRTLRVIFNNAIIKDIYPFGAKKNNKYQIPNTKKVKKALNPNQLKCLFDAEVKNRNEAKAKAFWFLSYSCNGMNLKDIALLKYSDIKGDKFEYYRAKTFDKSTEKKNYNNLFNRFYEGCYLKVWNQK